MEPRDKRWPQSPGPATNGQMCSHHHRYHHHQTPSYNEQTHTTCGCMLNKPPFVSLSPRTAQRVLKIFKFIISGDATPEVKHGMTPQLSQQILNDSGGLYSFTTWISLVIIVLQPVYRRGYKLGIGLSSPGISKSIFSTVFFFPLRIGKLI